jgi:hypothetical protein
VQEVIARLKRMRPKTPELREQLQSLIAYYSEHTGRMHYDEYLVLRYLCVPNFSKPLAFGFVPGVV